MFIPWLNYNTVSAGESQYSYMIKKNIDHEVLDIGSCPDLTAPIIISKISSQSS